MDNRQGGQVWRTDELRLQVIQHQGPVRSTHDSHMLIREVGVARTRVVVGDCLGTTAGEQL
jgi:hypothetical protein